MMQVGSAAPPPPTSATAASSNPPTPATLSPAAPSHHQNGTNVRSPNLAPTTTARLSGADRPPRAASVSPALSAGSSRHRSSNVNNNNNSNSNYNSFSSGKSGGAAYIGAATTLVSPSSSTAARSPSKVESVPKTHVANMRRRKNAAATSPEPPTKVAKVNGAMFASHQPRSGAPVTSPAQQHYHNIHLQHYHQPDAERLLSPPSTFGSAAYSAIAERLSDEAGSSSATTVTEKAIDVDSSYKRLVNDEDDVASGHREPAAATIPEPEPDPPPGPSTSSLSRKRRKKTSKKNRGDGDVVREKLQALSKTGRVKTTEELVAELKSLNDDRHAAGGSASEAQPGDRVDSCATGPSKPPSLSNSYVFSDSGSSAQQHRRVEEAPAGDCAGAAAAGNLSRVPIEQLDAEARVEREIADILARLPPLDVAQIRWDETPVSSPPASPRPPPTDEQVECYLHGRWDGVNGCVTHSIAPAAQDDAQASGRDEFREWHEMVARRTLNDDLIHILPYSIAD